MLKPAPGAMIGDQAVVEDVEELSKMADQGVMETLSEEVFSTYHCTSLPKSVEAVKHPGDIVEAGSLAAQKLPEAQYNIATSLPPELILQGKLSDLQLEGVLFACQRHQLILGNGERAGFFIGDGAGVGKGRQIAGIILDNFCRSRCKHVWFSISADLKMDAERDLKDIGCYVNVINGCQQLDKETRVFGLPPDFQEGVVFSTYSTLVSSVQKGSIDSGKQKRLSQLIDWCGGPDFDGCLIFDESHKAKHFIPGKEKASTKVAMAVTEIQRLLPKARVVYCSATGVTDLKNMAFMERLGLWGDGTAFKDFTVFLDSVTKRGLGALEMLAMEMKAAGIYVSRGLSYKETEFMTVETTLTPAQEKTYDLAVHVWNELKRSLSIAIERTKVNSPRIWVQYWACHQRFFRQMCWCALAMATLDQRGEAVLENLMSMKVPKIVEEATQAIEDGYCVVIGLQTTGEASLGQEITKSQGRIKGFVSLTREILDRFIVQNFPTDLQLNPHETKEDSWCVKAKDMLLSFVRKIELPDSPLDEIIDKLGGTKAVAEMTGRHGRICRSTPNGEPQYQLREADVSKLESLNIQERNAFMDGTKLVAIISDAASTGISLHADQRVGNQRRRVHITAELPWSADKAVQQLGRSHRSNQTSGPIYKLVTTNLGGERRFAAAVAKRLQSLGAITKGDRRAATGADLTQFNFDTQYGRQALRAMYRAICQHQIYPGVMLSSIIDPFLKDGSQEDFFQVMKECLSKMDLLEENVVGASVKERDAGTVSKFLNRILGLAVKKQNMIFAYFSECLKVMTAAARKEGRYNEGVTDVKANSITVIGFPVNVFTERKTGAVVTKHTALKVDRGITWEQALKRLESSNGPIDGFYCSKKEQWKKKLYLLAIQKDHSSHLFNIVRPNTGASLFEEDKSDLLKKYVRVSSEDAEIGWRKQYLETELRCIHGSGCKNSISCTVGCRTTQLHLLSGGIIELLSLLELTVVKYGATLELNREQRNLRIVRVELDDGSRLVGLRYPEPLIAHVSQTLKDAKISKGEKELDAIVTIEAETPINAKSKNKALTKPVTLKKFFKTASEDGCNSKKLNGIKVDISSKVMERGQNQTIESQINKVCKIGSLPVDTKREDTSATISKAASFSKTPSISQTSKRPTKRPCSNSNSDLSSKKQKKQISIFSSYARKTENSQNVKKAINVSCPICCLQFDSVTSNEEINAHIDSCLIE